MKTVIRLINNSIEKGNFTLPLKPREGLFALRAHQMLLKFCYPQKGTHQNLHHTILLWRISLSNQRVLSFFPLNIKKPPKGDFLMLRRGRDSNPRSTKDGQRFSRPPRSTALPPLHTTLYLWPADIT